MARIFAIAALGIVSTVASTFNPFASRFSVVDYIKQHAAAKESILADAPEAYLTQKLDHLNTSNTKTWQQRYFYHDEYYGGPGSPVFVFVAGESAMEAGVITYDGLNMNALGRKHSALLVTLEHRYYGKSVPTPDFSTPNLKYLTAEQALNDLLTFQNHLGKKFNLTATSKWVAFGGSYAGVLAAWAKFLHPTRWTGALSSSAPILAQQDFFQYADKVAVGLQYYGNDTCVNTIKAGLTAFDALVGSTLAKDAAKLKALFNPCTPVKDDYQRMMLEFMVFVRFQNYAQGNDWLPENLKTACEYFTTPNGKTPLEKLAYFSTPDAAQYCLSIDYNAIWINNLLLTDTTLDRGRQWSYQTCTEFGFGQTTSTSKGIFSALRFVTLDKVSAEMCWRAFGITRRATAAGVAATNRKYGGLKINVANVVFTNGNIDPWSALGLTNASQVVNPKSEAVLIDGTSHCRDLYAPISTDSLSLASAHERIDLAVARFLQKAP